MQKNSLKKKTASGKVKHKKMALGKGLDALIPGIEKEEDAKRDFFYCDIDLIRPNRFQPREAFSEEDLQELADSIKAQGVLQPLLVRKDDAGYELIAGERRLRASKRTGLTQVPVVIKRVTDDKLLEMSLVENIQRENLNPIEEAEAYHRLITQLNLTQDQASARVGKSRSAVANFLRLRQLPDQIKDSITDGTLSMGHGGACVCCLNVFGSRARKPGAAPEIGEKKAAGFHKSFRTTTSYQPCRGSIPPPRHQDSDQKEWAKRKS
jgi:ParB family chromosome partitioning protein